MTNKNIKNKKKSSRDAFTLIEVLVVVAISAVISVGGFVMFSQYRRDQDVRLAVSEFSSVVQDVQRRSVTQQNGKQWGIRISNDGNDSYQTWSGLTYASGTIDQTYSLKRSVRIGNPPPGTTLDLIFQTISGILGEKRIISLTAGKNSLVGDIILNTLGKTTTRIEKGLVGYWHFDEGTSTIAYDASGNENNGTLISGPTWQSGTSCKTGECLSFDGSGDNININDSDSLDIAGSFTISFWIKSGLLGQTNKYIFGKLNSAGNNNIYSVIYGYSTNKIQFYDDIGSGYGYPLSNSDITISDTNWHFVVYTYDGSSFSKYLDGASLGSINGVADFSISTGNLKIGTFDGTGHYLNGLLDEIRIYNRALSAQEVLDIYNDLK